MKIFFCFVFILTFAFTASNSLLSLFNLCDRNDENFEKCTVNEANRLMKTFANGIENYVPKLLPLNVFNETYENDFVIKLNEGTLNGIETFKVNQLKFNWNDKMIKMFGTFDKLELQSTCNINGLVLGKSLDGNGSINILAENVEFEGYFFLTFHRKKNDELYVKHIDNKIHLNPKNVQFKFADILGDATKEMELNNYLNENVSRAKVELLPIIEEVLYHLFEIIESNFHQEIPYKNFYINYN